ncbi:MAG TPA: RusA family crossover junction endodeoxyribonuclease [Phycisphaerae bacterium]|nr:RusA family crossover junction endodeoxyribonuclease [Phycisphaerae bacterium]
MLELQLPYPPSVNHYWRMWRGRMVISDEGRRYRESVCNRLAPAPVMGGNGPRKPPAGGRIALCMDAFPPDRRRRDLDNIQKALLDALEHAGVYADDSQIDLLVARRQALHDGGLMVVRLGALPLSRCPVCGAPLMTNQN